ncbi:MAG TPA: hypothetical protein VGZ23_02170 [bacterium]|nr:hypothetical protein [bacterium]
MRPMWTEGSRWGRTPRRLALVVFTFAPAAALFFLPLAVYKLPLRLYLYDRLVFVPTGAVLTALLACGAWFAVAIGVVLWPATARAPARSWSPGALAAAFAGGSLAGSAATLATSFCAIPRPVAELVHWLAFAPVAAIVLGAYLLRGWAGQGWPFRPWLIWGLIGLDFTVKVLLPLGLAAVGPAAFAVIALLYGFNAMGLPARTQLGALAVLCCLILVALPLKEVLRAIMYRGDAFAVRACVVTGGAGGAPAKPPAGTPASREGYSTALRAYSSQVATHPPETFGLWWPRLPGSWGVVEYMAARTVNRLNHLGDFAYVVATTPSRVPYAHGVTYAPIAGLLVPRALWAGKAPNDGGGQFYGHRYGFLDPADTVHSVNLPIITEGWLNDGWPGVLLSAVVVGAVLRVIWYGWIGESPAPGNVVIGMAVVSAAADQESSLALLLGGVLHAWVLYGLFDYLMRRFGKVGAGPVAGDALGPAHAPPVSTAR